MIEKQIGIATIFLLIIYFLFTQFEKFMRETGKQQTGLLQKNVSLIVSYYRSAGSFLLQKQQLLFLLLGMVTIPFLLQLPVWLMYQQNAQSLSLFSLLTGGSPYQTWSLLYPNNWDQVFFGFFSQIVGKLLFSLMTAIGSGSSSLLIIIFMIALCASYIEAVFLLWLKDQITKRTDQLTQLLHRAKIIWPQLFLFHLLSNATLQGLSLFGIRPSNLLVETIETISTGNLLVALVKASSALIFLLISLTFLVVPMILANREEKNMVQASRNVKMFFLHHYQKYFLFILPFAALASLISATNFVIHNFMPSNLILFIAPWTYGGLAWEFLTQVLSVYLLGIFTIALFKLVDDSR